MSTKLRIWRLAAAAIAPAILLALPVYGAATLKGQLVRNRIGGPPIAGAAVVAEGANPTTSTSLGAFTLEFPNKKPGERVKLTVSMPGMTVVNWVQLDVVLPADADGMNVLTLLLAREADREEMAAEYFRLRSTRAIEQQYQQRLQEAGQDKARLLRELEQAKALASQTAQELAKVQPGQASPLYEEAMRLVAEGKVDEALKTLDEAKLRARAQEVKERKEAVDKQLRETARDWGLRGSLLATKFRFAEAEAAYRSAIETAPEDFDRHFEFAYFLQKLNRYQAAREQYERCLSLARCSPMVSELR
jgi:hypothetical protein